MPAATDATRGGRVRAVHAQARPTLALALAFAVAAPVSAAVPHRTGTWLPLHVLLAGTVLLAISATSQLFAVTWSAAPAPSGGWVNAQRILLAGGVGGLALGRELAWPRPVVALAGSSVVASLVVLAGLLEAIRRGGPVRRFDLAVRHYQVGVAFGVAGCGLGVAMVAGGDGLRAAHLAANLLGLVGLVVLGTLPTFVATTARMRTSARLDSGALLPFLVGTSSIAVVVVALVSESTVVAGFGLVAWLVALGLVVRLLPRPGVKQLRWAGPRLLAVGCSLAWMAATVAVAAGRAFADDDPFPTEVVGALAVGGFAQLVWAALCYLVPVLRAGGHERLARSFAATRSPVGLVTLNLTAGFLAAGRPMAAGFAGAAAAADAVVRFAIVARGGDETIERIGEDHQ